MSVCLSRMSARTVMTSTLISVSARVSVLTTVDEILGMSVCLSVCALTKIIETYEKFLPPVLFSLAKF